MKRKRWYENGLSVFSTPFVKDKNVGMSNCIKLMVEKKKRQYYFNRGEIIEKRFMK